MKTESENVSQTSKEQYVTSRGERVSYASFFVGQNIIYMVVASYLMLYYTDYLGISAAAVGTIFLVARVWDAVNDPMMGIIVDKSNLKGGKFKPWINATVVILPLLTILLFVNPGLTGGAKVAYAAITYILWGMIYTISDVPIFSLSTAMTPNINERITILANGRVAAGIATLVIGTVTMPIVLKLGWTSAAIVLMVISMITMIPQWKMTKERVETKRERITFKSIVAYVKGNKYIQIVVIGYFFLSFLMASLGLGNYYAIYHLGSESYIAIIGLMTGIGGIIAAMMTPPVIKKTGKRNFLIGTLMVFAVSSILMYFTGYSNVTLELVLTFVRSFALMCPSVIFGMFTSDCIEYGHHETGVRSEALTFSLQTFITKLSSAVGGALTGIILTVTSYVPNVAQTQATLDSMYAWFTLLPAAAAVVWALIFFKFYDLTEEKVQEYALINSKK